jgi:uncharacterized repeat protein (TIGR04138 family)
MQSVHFDEILDAVVRQDPRYSREAYHFLREALDFTQRRVHGRKETSQASDQRHVSGQQLLEGVRDLALQSFGPMAYHLFETWGIRRCEDIGELVFNLVDHGRGMFGKTERDSRDDFKEGYDFHEAFRRPFLPGDHRAVRPEVAGRP